MSGCEVDVGGKGIFEYVCAKLESRFLTCQDE